MVAIDFATLYLIASIAVDIQTVKYFPQGIYQHRDNVIEDVFLRLYTGPSTSNYTDIRLLRSTELFKQPEFRRDNPTVIYVHGFTELNDAESVRTVVSAYLETRPEVNVILLDWSNMAWGSYFINAVPNSKKVTYVVAQQLKHLFDEGLNPDNIHIIGHSLGGQVAGGIGYELQKIGIKLLRITALDPAFPQFYPEFFVRHITGDDAELVDIIHTDAGGYGAPVHTGSADFWPNGGVAKQPGCPRFTFIPLSDDDFCSHWRSWRFYSESVRNPEAFPAARSKSYKEFKKDSDTSPEIIYMGYNADLKAKGDYYLTTNGASPYGKGMDGLSYQRK